MAQLNFHHLRYFWAVAKEGNLTRAAAGLHVSQSALSAQIRQLEDQLGQPLFARVGRGLQLTEAGRIALGYAESIFASGQELSELLREGRRAQRQVLRLGAVATMSRNLQQNFVLPVLARDDVALTLQSGTLPDLLARLRVHSLDLVLSNTRVYPSVEDPWRCRRIARQQVSLVGKPRATRKPFDFVVDLSTTPLLLPGRDSELRSRFDLLCDKAGVRYTLRAEVDDMAMMRLMARESDSIALLPTVVVQDELRRERLVELMAIPELYENFYAVSLQRRFESPIVKALLHQTEDQILTGPALWTQPTVRRVRASRAPTSTG